MGVRRGCHDSQTDGQIVRYIIQTWNVDVNSHEGMVGQDRGGGGGGVLI